MKSELNERLKLLQDIVKEIFLPEIITGEAYIASKKETTSSYPSLRLKGSKEEILYVIIKDTGYNLFPRQQLSPTISYNELISSLSIIKKEIKIVAASYRRYNS